MRNEKSFPHQQDANIVGMALDPSLLSAVIRERDGPSAQNINLMPDNLQKTAKACIHSRYNTLIVKIITAEIDIQ